MAVARQRHVAQIMMVPVMIRRSFSSLEEKKTTRPSLLTYARAVEGCVVRMLTRGSLPEHSDAGEAACGRAPPPSSVEVATRPLASAGTLHALRSVAYASTHASTCEAHD